MHRALPVLIAAGICGVSACGAPPSASGAPAEATGDPRNITTAPVTPPVCTTVSAQGAAPQGEAAGTRLDTSGIQAALDRCGAGRGVLLSGGAFLSGPLLVPSGVSLIIGQGATLYASRQAALYDDARKPGAAHCGQYDGVGKSCQPLITLARNSTGSGVYGPGVIDGQGGQPIIYPAGWTAPQSCSSSVMPQGFPRVMSWWDLANCAVVERKQTGQTVLQDNPVLIRSLGGRDLTFSGVTLLNSPRSHLQVSDTSGVTIWGVKIDTPSDYAAYGMPRAHNTDGINWTDSNNITVAYSYINDGDDYIAINAKATSLSGPSANITIAHDHFYGGHGVSIGSLVSGGIRNVLVEDVVIDGGPNLAAMYGLHIKSNGVNGGPVDQVTYRQVCIRDARYPIALETNYGGRSGGNRSTYKNIVLDNVSIFNGVPDGGKVVFDGSGASEPLEVAMRDVTIDDARQANASVSHNAAITLAGSQSFLPKGDGVSVAPGGYTLDGRARPSAACQAALAHAPPFPISRQEGPRTPD